MDFILHINPEPLFMAVMLFGMIILGTRRGVIFYCVLWMEERLIRWHFFGSHLEELFNMNTVLSFCVFGGIVLFLGLLLDHHRDTIKELASKSIKQETLNQLLVIRQELASTTTVQEALQTLLGTIVRQSEVTAAIAYLRDEQVNTFSLAAVQGMPEEALESDYASISIDHPSYPILAGKQPFFTQASRLPFPVYTDPQEACKAVAFFPIQYLDQNVAAIIISSHVVSDFSLETRSMMETLASQVGNTIARIQAEESVRENRQDLYAVLDSMDDMVFIADRPGNILHTNLAVKRRLNYSQDELLEKNLVEYFPLETRKEARRMLRQAFRAQNFRINLPLLTKTGEPIPVEIITSRTRWRGIEVMAGICRDVSEQTRILEAEADQRILAEALRDTARVLNSTLNLEEVFDITLTNVGKVVPSESSSLMLLENGVARIIRCHGYQKRGLEKMVLSLRFPLSTTPNMQLMYNTQKPVVISDVQHYKDWVFIEQQSWIQSFVGAPIIARGKVLGFLNLDSPIPGFYNEVHAERLKSFADQVALAMINAEYYETMRERAYQLSMLNEITLEALEATDLRQMLRLISRRILALFHADGIQIILWPELDTSMEYVSYPGKVHSIFPRLDFTSLDTDPILSELRHGRNVLLSDIKADDRFSGQANSDDFIAIFGMPLVVNEKNIGAALLGYSTPRKAPYEYISFAAQVTAQLALAVEKVRLMEKERSRIQELESHNRLVTDLEKVISHVETAHDFTSVLSTLDLELNKIGIRYLAAFPRESGKTFYFGYVSNQEFVQPVVRKYLGTDIQAQEFPYQVFKNFSGPNNMPLGEFIPSVLSKFKEYGLVNQPELIEPFARIMQFQPEMPGMILPLLLAGSLKGILLLWGNDLRESDLSTYSVFASQVAIGLENARLYTELQRQAITDDLTGLYNRRGLFELGQYEMERAMRFRRPLSVLMLDLDHFKDVNDLHGHATGDQVLQILAERCRSNLREIDIIGRYGGEEFVVLLPETGRAAAEAIAVRLQQIIGQIPFQTETGPISITVSIGVAEGPGKTRQLSELIKLADQALYDAKLKGRNRVIVYD